jgi:tetratricopeptide (TPR) repeat protein
MRRILPAFILLLTLSTPAAAEHEHGSMPAAGNAGAPPALLSGFGNTRFHVTTRSREAQRYFDQGLDLCYAFNHDEAIRAFEEVARLDPQCAMAHWGIAYACGPNINLPMDAEHGTRAYEETQKALALAPKASPRERDYIEALAKRYGVQPVADQHALDVSYADAMRQVMKKYPADLDAATLFAEAMMDLRPWDLYAPDGTPYPGTDEIVSTLERVLQKNPKHVGAIHFYIHAVEASSDPGRGLKYAERLPNLAPNAGHLVHMPTHLYIRVGRYDEVSSLNVRALDADKKYLGPDRLKLDLSKGMDIYRIMYYTHNIHMRWAGLVLEGRSADALTEAREVASNVPAEAVRMMPPMEFWSPVVYYTLVRFGKWDDMLGEPAPPADLRFASGVWHYGRALAFIAKGQLGDARVEQDSLAAIEAATPEDAMIGSGNRTKAVLHVATQIASGKLAMAQRHPDDAIRALSEAVRAQDQLRYDEPPIWYYTSRQSLGAALVLTGRPAEAEEVFQTDLRQHPANGWSLYGLMLAQRAKGDLVTAAETEKEFKKAWAWSDATLSVTLL